MKDSIRIYRPIIAAFSIGMTVLLMFSVWLPSITKAATSKTAIAAVDESKIVSAHVIVLPLDDVDWEDFINPEYPVFQQLAQRGAVGLANMNTGDGHGTWNEYASYSEGGPVRFTPLSPSPVMSQTQFPINWFQNALQQKRTYEIGIGGLGQSVRDAGFVTGYIGARRINKTTVHPAAMLVIDKQGNIPFYVTDNSNSYTVPDRFAPAGKRDTVQTLIDHTAVFLHGKSGLLTIGMGDLARLESERERITAANYKPLRKQALTEVNDLIQGVAKQLSYRDTLLIMTVTPTTGQVKKQEWFGPVAIVGPDFAGGSILTSKTTRQQGIVANLDIVPTILQQLGIQSDKIVGHPLETIENSKVPNQQYRDTTNQNLRMLTQKLKLNMWYTGNRAPILIGLAGLVVIILIGCLIRILGGIPKQKIQLPKRTIHKKSKLLLPICFGSCLLPTSFLLSGAIHRLILFHIGNQWVDSVPVVIYVVWIVFLAVACSLPVMKMKDWNWRVLYLSGFMLLVYGILLTFQDGAFSQSLLGYDPVFGARYYGIGNEYMAGFVAAWFMFLAAATQVFGKRMLFWGWFVSGLFVLYLASPVYGANIGGAVTVGFGSVLLLYRMQVGGWNKRGWFVMAGSLVVIALMIGVMQEVPNLPSSHAGVMVRLLERKEWGFFGFIMNRKIDMNVKMLLISPFWLSVGLLAMLGTAYVFVHHPLYKQWKREQHPFYQMILSSIFSAAIGYLTNDSGIIVSLFMLYPILFIMLGWMSEAGTIDWRLFRIQMMFKSGKEPV